MPKKFRKVVVWDEDSKSIVDFFGMWIIGIFVMIFFPIVYVLIYRNVHWEEIKKSRKTGGASK